MEGTQVTQLHWNALRHQLRQALRNLDQHRLNHIASEQTAVIHHVLCETAQRKGLLRIYLGVVLTVGGASVVLVLTEIYPHRNFLCCHFIVF